MNINYILALLFCICITNNYADMRDFQRFSAPSVTGAYRDDWAPLGPTEKGHLFSIGFYLMNGSETSPSILWLKKGETIPIEVDSLSLINLVSNEFETRQDATANYVGRINLCCKLICRSIASRGRTGFALDGVLNPSIDLIFLNLRKAGIPDSDLKMLKGMCGHSSVQQGAIQNEWSRSWLEIDAMGMFERVSVSGRTVPFRVMSVLREIVEPPVNIRSELLVTERLLAPDHPE